MAEFLAQRKWQFAQTKLAIKRALKTRQYRLGQSTTNKA